MDKLNSEDVLQVVLCSVASVLHNGVFESEGAKYQGPHRPA